MVLLEVVVVLDAVLVVVDMKRVVVVMGREDEALGRGSRERGWQGGHVVQKAVSSPTLFRVRRRWESLPCEYPGCHPPCIRVTRRRTQVCCYGTGTYYRGEGHHRHHPIPAPATSARQGFRAVRETLFPC